MIDRGCISLNSRCNLRCRYCHFGEKKGNVTNFKEDFSREEIEKFATNLINFVKTHEIPKFKLGIVGSGEPLLNFDLIEILVKKIAESGIKESFKLYTITNGLLMNDEILDFFYRYREIIDVNFSLDGYKEINDKNRAGFDTLFKILKKYEERFKTMPLVNAVIFKESIENREKLINFFLENKIFRVNFSKIFGDVETTLTITDKEYADFLEYAKTQGIKFRQNTSEKIYDCAKYGRLCGVGRTNIYIAKSGIYPCARFLGNEKYRLGEATENFDKIQSRVMNLTPCPDFHCYYEYNNVGDKI